MNVTMGQAAWMAHYFFMAVWIFFAWAYFYTRYIKFRKVVQKHKEEETLEGYINHNASGVAAGIIVAHAFAFCFITQTINVPFLVLMLVLAVGMHGSQKYSDYFSKLDGHIKKHGIASLLEQPKEEAKEQAQADFDDFANAHSGAASGFDARRLQLFQSYSSNQAHYFLLYPYRVNK